MSRRIFRPNEIVSIIAGAVGTALSITLDYVIPLGIVATVILLFYKYYGKNPFRLSKEKLRSLIHEAREIEEQYSRKLYKLQKVKERIDKGEIRGDTMLLDVEIKRIEEVVRMAKLKIEIVELVLMIREGVEVFKKLFGENNFAKLVSNVDELNKEIDKMLKREGVAEINEEELVEYIRGRLMPLILVEPGKHRVVEAAVEELKKEIQVEHEKKLYIPVEDVWKLLEYGSVKQWLELIEKSSKESMKIRLPLGVHHEREGYKNLLRALLITNTDMKTIKSVVEDRALVRMVELFKKLKNEKSIEFDPQDSSVGYIEDALKMISSSVDERIEGDVKVKVYRISIPDLEQKQIEVEKKVVKDSKSGIAVKVVFRIL